MTLGYEFRSVGYRLGLLFVSFATGAIIYSYYPARPSYTAHDVLIESAVLLTAVSASLFIYRLRVEALELGWSLFTYALFIDLIDELMATPSLLDATFEGIIKVLGLGLTVTGLYLSQIKLREGLDESQTQLQKQLKKSNEMKEELRETNRKLSVLNRVLRHDIRNRTNVLIGYADMLEGDSETQKIGRDIKEKAFEISNISDRVREIERLLSEGGASKLEINMVGCVESAIEDIEENYDKPIEISTHTPDEAFAYADELVEFAIKNVIENAVEHNTSEDPYVDIRVKQTESEVVVKIDDNGPGIPSNELEVLKKDFETQLEHVSGLGLWFTHWIITESDGEIEFESSSEGTKVTIKLPKKPTKNQATKPTENSFGE